ncbi:MAG: hypothetical protein ABI311_00245 [Gemmatimonadaceae bacterium]
MRARRRVGVIGTFVWDEIHGRDPIQAPIQEWGGITYALAGLDASLSDDWEIVPLIKVGSDLAQRARSPHDPASHGAGCCNYRSAVSEQSRNIALREQRAAN